MSDSDNGSARAAQPQLANNNAGEVSDCGNNCVIILNLWSSLFRADSCKTMHLSSSLSRTDHNSPTLSLNVDLSERS